MQYKMHIIVMNKGFKSPQPGLKPSFSLRNVSLEYPAAESSKKTMDKWLLNMKTGYNLVNPDLIGIPDHRKTSKYRLKGLNKVFEKAVWEIPYLLLVTPFWDVHYREVDTSYSVAEPLGIFAKEFKIYLTGLSHFDFDSLKINPDAANNLEKAFAAALDYIDQYPGFHFAQDQASIYEWIEINRQDIFNRIKTQVKAGKWEITGGTWGEPALNPGSTEHMIRQFLYGKRYFKEKFGVDVLTGLRWDWNQDSPGCNRNIPQVYVKSGIKRLVAGKAPYFVFWWKGIDETKLLTYSPPLDLKSNPHLPEDARVISRFEAVTGFKKSLLFFDPFEIDSVTHIGALDKLQSYKNLKFAPGFVYSKSLDFFVNLERDIKHNIPNWIERWNTPLKEEVSEESFLLSAEKMAAIAFVLGKPYPADILNKAWKMILTRTASGEDYRNVREEISQALKGSLDYIDFILMNTHDRNLPLELVFFNVTTPGIRLDSIKKAEDDNGIILRLVETNGSGVDSEIVLFKAPVNVYETDLLERPLMEYPVDGKSLRVPFKKFEIKTLKIIFED